MDIIIILKTTQILMIAVLLFKLRKDLKKGEKVFLWTFSGYLLIAITIIFMNYFSNNLEYWQMQVFFPLILILVVIFGYKADKAENKYKEKKKLGKNRKIINP